MSVIKKSGGLNKVKHPDDCMDGMKINVMMASQRFVQDCRIWLIVELNKKV